MFDSAISGNLSDIAQQAYKIAIATLPNLKSHSTQEEIQNFEQAASELLQATFTQYSVDGAGFDLYLGISFRGASNSCQLTILDQEVQDSPFANGENNLTIYCEWITDRLSELVDVEPEEGEEAVTFEAFCEDCTIEVDAKIVDLNDPLGELPLTLEEKQQNALSSGVIRAYVMKWQYMTYLDQLDF